MQGTKQEGEYAGFLIYKRGISAADHYFAVRRRCFVGGILSSRVGVSCCPSADDARRRQVASSE